MNHKFSYPPKYDYQNSDDCMWQNPMEFYTFFRFLMTLNFISYLEIGTRNGKHLEAVRLTSWCNEDRIWGIDIDPKGDDPQIIKGDSKSEEVQLWAKEQAPWDVVYIDGDHSYLGVKADFDFYGRLAKKAIVLHDIDANQTKPFPCDTGVKQLWKHIRIHYATIEIRDITPFNYGIGIILL